MALRSGRSSLLHPIAAEFALVTAALVGFVLWRRVVTASLSAAFGTPPAPGGLLLYGLGYGGLLVAGLAAFAGAYAAVRDIPLGLSFPSRADRRVVGATVAVPLVLVGVTKLVGVLTDVPYGSLTKSSYAVDAPLAPVLLVAGLGLLVGVPVLVVVGQVVVQGSFERAVGRSQAVVWTTLVTGFAMTSSDGLTTAPGTGKLVGIALFSLALAVALYAAGHVARAGLRYLAYAPVLLFVALVVASGVAEIDSVAETLFAATHLAVLGIAAHAYERTDSLLPPALAYASLSLANGFVVFAFEAGLRSW
ncbi:hypothetical protein SAMN04488063_3286 [Halopelagius inordinatus]|uniref:CAAX protease self-immunity n=1 Tax=Halopelagius inordinatus TaxID=553467 RepID=A0A1I2VT52_9EURY|nr:hypothetical protein [Halopelagius inordinatus]SFG91629.1 hypothetical protein SAMN04488063_3286 [Halopelagius inordinatus]